MAGDGSMSISEIALCAYEKKNMKGNTVEIHRSGTAELHSMAIRIEVTVEFNEFAAVRTL